MVDLERSINFTNDNYFDTRRLRRLLRSAEMRSGGWFAVDGMSTGVVFMQFTGVVMEVVPRASLRVLIGWLNWYIFNCNIGARPA